VQASHVTIRLVPDAGNRQQITKGGVMRKLLVLFGCAITGLASEGALAAACAGFVDVDSVSSFCPSVAWVKSRGITLGCTDATHYCPNDPVTRLQMAAFMYRLGFQNTVLNGGNAFGTTAVLGTTDNQPLDIRVNGSRVMRYEPDATSPNMIGGLANNSVAPGVHGAAIAGGGAGGTQLVLDFGGAIVTYNCTVPPGGSCGNWVLDAFGVIGGGVANRAGNGTGTLGNAAVATVGGGFANSAAGVFSTVAGGQKNTASGESSSVSGGWNNQAIGARSVVGGGQDNMANGNNSVVVGGYDNVANGFGAIAGGRSSFAGGTTSIALGDSAKAYVDGSFVFSDSTPTDFSSGLANEFLVGATGGIGMYTAKNYTTGCHIPAGGGSWSCSSSRDVKTGFAAVDTRLVVDKLLRLPLATWQFINERSGARHLGPVAQDFSAAFGLGDDGRSISVVDASGVAFAAIQGLNARFEAQIAERDGKIEAQRSLLLVQVREIGDQHREIAELRERLAQVESMRGELAALRDAIAAATRDVAIAAQETATAPVSSSIY
jgi:hypothetical protein